MAQVRWSLTAGNDLQDIENFIARDSVLHAITFVDRMVESTETLLTGYIGSGLAITHFPTHGGPHLPLPSDPASLTD